MVVESAVGCRCSAFHFLEAAAEVVGILETYTVSDLLHEKVIPCEQTFSHPDPFQGDIVGACHTCDLFEGPAEYREVQADLLGYP